MCKFGACTPTSDHLVQGYHMNCLDPPVRPNDPRLPAGCCWYCDACTQLSTTAARACVAAALTRISDGSHGSGDGLPQCV